MANEHWPELPYEGWTDTRETLHRWLQIVGKIRLAKAPWENHGWQSALYVTARGLTTSVIHDVARSFSLELDFVAHRLALRCSDGGSASIPLRAESVAAFHRRCFSALRELGIAARIHGAPNEIADATPFLEDETHRAYDPDSTNRYWRALLQADRLMKRFKARFVGKSSPVHFFWGSNDLAVTRFSGRRAPEHPGGFPNLPDRITKEAYSHEVSSCGFWPGNATVPFPAFYSYAYPMRPGFESARARPAEAGFHAAAREFILPYEAVRSAADPDRAVLEFFQSTYEAAAETGRWDRARLEDSPFLEALKTPEAA